MAALSVLEAEPERVMRLRANSAHFLSQAHSKNLDTGNGEGLGIVPIIIGNTFKLGKLEKRLFDRGIVASPILAPAVPINAGRLRFFVTSEHTRDDIEHALEVLREEVDA